jgi:DNA-binding transcriptional LysR family regulator
MLNIPTDLLRTLVSVVDLRSFTKAAQSLGVTQPAVSAQIKRLQFLLGYDLLDKSAPGVSLTPRGEIVINNARRLLSINDEILHMAGSSPSAQTLRVGTPCDYAGARIPTMLAQFRTRWPDIRFSVSRGTFDTMVRDLNHGDIDLFVAITTTEPTIAARHRWTKEAVWVRSDATRIDPDGPVPLVSYADDCACQRIAVASLHRSGRDCDFVYTSRSLISLAAAVAAGFGVMVMPRRRVDQTNLMVWDDPPLPKLPELYCGVFLREDDDRTVLKELADEFASDLSPDRLSQSTTKERAQHAVPVNG